FLFCLLLIFLVQMNKAGAFFKGPEWKKIKKLTKITMINNNNNNNNSIIIIIKIKMNIKWLIFYYYKF
ncbi:MAG: hypothetical protein N7Q72_07035, partial [Spiroplasma sp. Tabriz.8]|nr:hypothetical protein [Spiroplasma sp. Tabriz.8]